MRRRRAAGARVRQAVAMDAIRSVATHWGSLGRHPADAAVAVAAAASAAPSWRVAGRAFRRGVQSMTRVIKRLKVVFPLVIHPFA